MRVSNRSSILILSVVAGVVASLATAADLPTRKAPPAPVGEEWLIHGAIAYSPSANVDGLFWGGATAEEADGLALQYCRNAASSRGGDCQLAIHFTQWRDARERYESREHCGALAVSRDATSRFIGARGETGDEASQTALAACGGGDVCYIKTLVCT